MLHSLEAKLSEAWPTASWNDVTVVVAVSGGSDSVALLRAMVGLKEGGTGRLCAAHFNHRLRPEADDDERFVVDLCQQVDVPCEVERAEANSLLSPSGKGIESAARAARYRFLQRVAGRLGARYVATAHTANDQAETVLHRIVRGTGVRGLAGIRRIRRLGHATLVRPMLAIHHGEILEYLRDHQQPYRHDESNWDTRFTRNRIRHKLLPQLQQDFNTNVVSALLRLSALASEAQAVVDALTAELLERHVSASSANSVEIDLHGLADRSLYLVGELLMAVWRQQNWPMQAMGLAQWDELSRAALAAAPPEHLLLPGGITVTVAAGHMRLAIQSLIPRAHSTSL